MGVADSRLVDSMLRYLRAGVDTSARAELLAAHGVALLLNACRADELTDDERKALTEAARPHLLASLQSEELAVTVTRALSGMDIRHVVYKGPVLARRWQDVTGNNVRTFTDLDVLIEPEHRRLADQALTAAGLLRGPIAAGEASYRSVGGGVLDLHWLPLNDEDITTRFRLETTQLFETETVWEDNVGTFSPALTLLHTAGHAVISDLAKLSAPIDIHAAATDPALDFDLVVDLAHRHSMGLVLSVALSRTRLCLDLPLRSEALNELDGHAVWRRLARWVARRDPARYLGARWSGGEFYRHTRETTASSIASLLGSMGVNIKVQRELLKRRRGTHV